MKISLITQKIQHFFWIWLTLILAFYLSWISLSQQNFLYGLWHDHAGIGENIEIYAPQNRFRHGFETTDAETRASLFAGMVDAIHNQGAGLKQLSYINGYNQKTTPLLHRYEIEHLTDVANLIDFLAYLGWGLLLIWAALTTYMLMAKNAFPSWLSAVKNILSGLLITGLLIMLFGAKNLFYQLHIWIFPAEHKWFFYYQDSLMSTMMKAPDLFAYIATILTLLGLLIFAMLTAFFKARLFQTN